MRTDQPDSRPDEVRGIWPRALLYMCVVGGGWLLLLPLAILSLEKGRPAIALRRKPWAVCGAATCTAGAAVIG